MLGAAFAVLLLTTSLLYPPLQSTALVLALCLLAILGAAIILLIARLRDKIDDVQATLSLEFGLARAGHSPVNFFYDEAAATPSLQLLHFKILQFCRPASILEIGSGQTTKLLSYYSKENAAAEVITLEQDRAFWEILKPLICHTYVHAEIRPAEFKCHGTGRAVATQWFDADALLLGKKFEYILVDGPDHADPNGTFIPLYRGGILKFIPQILAQQFAIVFDDADRLSDRTTVDALKDILRANQIKHVSFDRHGIKTQAVICSPNWSFIRTV